MTHSVWYFSRDRDIRIGQQINMRNPLYPLVGVRGLHGYKGVLPYFPHEASTLCRAEIWGDTDEDLRCIAGRHLKITDIIEWQTQLKPTCIKIGKTLEPTSYCTTPQKVYSLILLVAARAEFETVTGLTKRVNDLFDLELPQKRPPSKWG